MEKNRGNVGFVFHYLPIQTYGEMATGQPESGLALTVCLPVTTICVTSKTERTLEHAGSILMELAEHVY